MAIAKMRKLKIAAMSYDRDAILDRLQKTGAAEIKECTLGDELPRLEIDAGDLRSSLAVSETALAALSGEVSSQDKDKKVKDGELKDGFEVSYSDFMDAYKTADHEKEVISKISSLVDDRNHTANEITRCQRILKSAEIYKTLEEPFNTYKDTSRAAVKLGTMAKTSREAFMEAMKGIELADCKVLAEDEDSVLLAAVAHKSARDELDAALSAAGFTPCPYSGTQTGAEFYAATKAQIEALQAALQENADAFYALKPEVKPLKVYCDYLGFQLEKAETSGKFAATERTFILEAYVPAMCEEMLTKALQEVTGAIYIEFNDVAEDEMPPTLMENNPVVSNFETITNMYSPPNAKEFDPSTIMAVFYSIFLGFIMGDIGYGALMLIGGLAIVIYCGKRPSGLKNMAAIFAVGGVFGIIWGFLFNAFFGMPILGTTVLPDAQTARWGIVGIQVPAVLVIALIIGCVHLMAGYICKAIQCCRRKEVGDGFFEGVVWAIFTIGVIIAIIGVTDTAPDAADAGDKSYTLAYAGGIIAGVALVVAIFTAGRHEKIVGKFTKGFGALYGVINYVSDILSYARLYGLMLSGTVIANLVSTYAIQFISGDGFGGAWIILGLVLILVGHGFNLAISLLGAYIHDARLQYVEFYGKFYEGDGELFTPIGSKHKYVYVAPQKQEAAAPAAGKAGAAEGRAA
ncbi:MAG: V-type ATP synthase subunit I [Clostridia bacterium]|nr:V-type ATP synthase subunit I [Clostridia bacterium]